MNEAKLSVFEAVDEAFQKTKAILFSPFDLQKWLTLGFCAFLSAMAQGGGGGGFAGNPFGGAGDAGREAQRMTHWMGAHLPLVVALGIVVLILALALGALFQWLGSRGQFMFMDSVARNRAAVAEPWNRFRRLGNSLFIFRFLFGLAALALFLLLAGGLLAALLPSIRSQHLTAFGLLAIVAAVFLFVPLILAIALFQLSLRDFVVPVMARRDLAAVPALRVFAGEILKGRVAEFVLFYVMALLLGIAAGVLITIGTCVTCCIAGLPYVSSVVFLPVFVFFRAFSLSFLRQVGPQWDLYAKEPPVASPAPSGNASPPSFQETGTNPATAADTAPGVQDFPGDGAGG
jgi:hypothetical protein